MAGRPFAASRCRYVRPPWQRSLTDRPLAEVMRWSVARRDRALFDFRAQVFGDRVEAVTFCPACGSSSKCTSRWRRSRRRKAPPRVRRFGPLRIGGTRIRCRLPNSEDLLAVASLTDIAEARDAADRPLRAKPTTPICASRPRHSWRHQADDVQLDLTCPSCGHAWQTAFDIAAFVWRELDDVGAADAARDPRDCRCLRVERERDPRARAPAAGRPTSR